MCSILLVFQIKHLPLLYVLYHLTSYLESIFAPHKCFIFFKIFLKIYSVTNYFIILRFRFPFLSSYMYRRLYIILLGPSHSFYVLLGRMMNHLKRMTLKINVKTQPELKIASPATPWT